MLIFVIGLRKLQYRDYRDYIRVTLGLYMDNGKDNGDYYIIMEYILGSRPSLSMVSGLYP